MPLDMTDFWSASLLDFLLPNLRHPIWGSHVRALLPTGPDYAINEFVLSWGFVIMLLALYGRRWARAPATKGMCWMVWAGLLLSLGMTLHLVVALPILIPVPSSVAQPYNTAMNWLSQDLSPLHERFTLARESSIALPMPGLFLRWLVPGFEAMRSWGRFASGAAFAMVTLAGLGLDAWYQQRLRRVETSTGAVRRRLWLMAGVLCCLLLFEFWTGPQRLVRVEPRLVDKWLADQPGTFAIMQYPIRSALSGPHLLYTRYHGKKVIFGYGVYFDTQFRRRYPELSLFPADPSLDTLASLDVRYILLNLQQLPSPQWPVPDDVAPDVISQIAQQPRLRLIGTFDSVQVYEVKP